MRHITRATATAVAVAAVGTVQANDVPPASAHVSCPATTGHAIRNTPATLPRTVALTFDDGPNPEFTPQVLAVLRKHGVHGTFFVVGTRVARHPELVKQVAADGNVIGNHSWTHPTAGDGFAALNRAEVDREIGRTTQLVQHFTNRPVCFFRAPQGKDKAPAVHQIARIHRLTVTNMHSAGDYLQPKKVDADWVSRITERLVDQGNHPILLLHDGGAYRKNSVLALERIITWYKRRGYVFTDPAGRPFPDDPAASAPAPTDAAARGKPTPAAGAQGQGQPGGGNAPAPAVSATIRLHQSGPAIGHRPAEGGLVPF